MFTILLLLPFIETWITGDKREHHLLQRPRDVPTRTATMVALMTFYGLLWAAGGNDIIAIKFSLSINQITYFMRVLVFVLPVVAFLITRRWCISLQRPDQDRLLHGYESGIIMRSAEGGYSERHLPLSPDRAYVLAARDRDPDPLPEERRRPQRRRHPRPRPHPSAAASTAPPLLRRQRPEAHRCRARRARRGNTRARFTLTRQKLHADPSQSF